MNGHRPIAWLVCAVWLLAALPASAATPNIVLILADDFGYGSLGAYGASPKLLRTPNMDRLAREGVRFTDANTSSSVCSPTRYSVLTGRYAWRSALRYGVLEFDAPLLIEPGRLTLASLLKRQGYRTAAIGKWHLGYGVAEHVDFTGSLRPGPLEVGFDYHFGVPSNHGDVTGVYVEDDHVVGLRSPKLAPFGWTTAARNMYLGLDAPQRVDDTVMQILTDKAVAWIGQQQAGKPFFLYFTPVAPHEPVSPSAATAGTSKAGPYGDWIHELDLSVGRVLAALEKKGFAKDTVVLLTSDNGGENKKPPGGRGTQITAQEAGLKINGDLRAGKHSIFQGGFQVPFIVRWPGEAPAGKVCREAIGLSDLLATVAAIVGEKLRDPGSGGEDSVNVLPAFLGEPLSQPLRADLVLHSADGVFAIRQGPWKLIEGKPTRHVGGMIPDKVSENRLQLYNLAEDPSEKNDLVKEHPEVVERLSKLLQQRRTQE